MTQTFELLRTIENVTEDKVFVEMATDQPYEKASYMYEAGKTIDNKFIPEFIWHSENPHLFD